MGRGGGGTWQQVSAEGADGELTTSLVSNQLSTPGTTLAKYFLAFCRRAVSDRRQFAAPEETLNLLVLPVALLDVQLLRKKSDC